MRTALAGFVTLIALLLGVSVQAAQVVHVGGYDFPPFVDAGKDSRPALVPQVIDALNQMQSQYRFEFVPVAARRRYGDLVEGRFDVMFFESPQWEWQAQGFPVDFTKIFLRGGEVYIAQAMAGRGQDYFADLSGKSLVGILGYHYGFADFEADPERLARTFDIKLVNSHRSSIELVLNGRRDIAVVTDAYLHGYLLDNPKARDRLLISQRLDQTYEHRVLVRQGGPIAVATMEKLMDDLAATHRLGAILRAAGIGN